MPTTRNLPAIATISVVILFASWQQAVLAETPENDTLPGAHEGAGRPATVLLICGDELSAAWRPFAEWKTRLGKATRIVTVGQIQQRYEGDDLQQQIRACCLDHIARHGTRWVVLGGDSSPDNQQGVPDRDTRHRSIFARFDDIPTDVYYISDKDWDANDDGIYGDWSHDKSEIAYTNAKASIGRIPLRTAEDVAAYTAKVIAYETHYPGQNFAAKLIYTCPERGAYPKLNTSRDSLAEAWGEGQLLQFFGNKTPWDDETDGDHDLSPDNFVRLINQRTAGKLHVHGHGLLPVWVLENGQTVEAAHVGQLENEAAYLVMTTVSCFTGQYDADQDPSITEMMLRQPGGGAVIVVAPSRQGVPVFHDPRRDFPLMISAGKMDGTTAMMTHFWQSGLTENLTAGEAMRAAKAALADDAVKSDGYHFIQCELNLLGDPTLDLRAKDPITPQLKVPREIKPESQPLNIATDAPGATVCLWKGADVYQVATADEQGNVAIEISPSTPGTLLVTVSGPSLNAALTEIAVRAE